MVTASDWVDLRRVFPWLHGQRLHVVAAHREAAVLDGLARHHFTVVALDGHRLSTLAAFVDKAGRALGAGKNFGKTLDALNDTLADLDDRPTRRIAFCWRASDHLLAADLSAFVDAVVTLAAAAADLGTLRDDDVPPLQLEIFLFSQHPGAA